MRRSARVRAAGEWYGARGALERNRLGAPARPPGRWSEVALAARVELRIGKSGQHGGAAGGRVEEGPLFTREFGGGAHAYAGGIEAAARRVRKERILFVKLRELPFHHAADEHDGQHPLPRFVGAHHVDRVAAPILQAQRFETKNALDRTPVLCDTDLAPGIEGGGRFGERFV